MKYLVAGLRTAVVALICAVAIALLSSVLAQNTVQDGYAVVTGDAGSPIPVGSALFSYTNSAGVLVSEAGVGAVTELRTGRIFVDEVGTQTGIALVNPSAQDATATLILRDSSGNEIARRTLTLPAQRHIAQYVSQLFADRPSNFTGSLSFVSDQPLAAVTLRESHNGNGEPVYTTLPVIDQSAAASREPMVFSQIAAGDGYTTQILLINPGDQILRGRISLVGSGGGALPLRASGVSVAEIPYQINPQGTYRVELSSESDLRTGYAVVTPDAGNMTPSGSAVFRFQSHGQLVTDAGVPAGTSTTVARVFVDYIGSQTGVALANAGDLPADLTVTLMDRYGVVEATASRTLAARNHLAIFVHELFPGVRDGYSGLMEIRSTNPIVPITLKLTINSRNELVLTTLPVADLVHTSMAGTFVFPQIALGSGFSTQLILVNPDTYNAATGTMTFYQSLGTPAAVPMGGRSASQYSYRLMRGGARRLYPGNVAAVRDVALVDPSSNQTVKELFINEGNTVRPRLQIIDSTGKRRDDFDAALTSINPDIATVDAIGNVQGRKKGFSTLTIAVSDIVATATASVVTVDKGDPGVRPNDIVKDLAQRLYLASMEDDSILLAQDLKHTPQVYAGIPRTAGLKNDLRLQSLFHNPAFLALNQAGGNLYVSDGANNVIRHVRSGPSGRVETLAGTGASGSQDGPPDQATFNNPQGIGLDNRGNLWVVDSGNHTIRRVNTSTGMVETIAGKAGMEGFADGNGDEARFRTPIGIAIEVETPTQQQERLRTGGTPPPVRVIVADTGNGAIRRVTEDRTVETIQLGPLYGANASPKRAAGFRAMSTAPPAAGLFNSPTSVAVDSVGNIYVTEPSTGQVRVVLKNNQVVAVAQTNTFQNPKGIVISQTGGVVIADGSGVIVEVRYGEPQIISVSPARISIRGGQTVTVRGNNFAPDTSAVLAGVIVPAVIVEDTQTLTFTAPASLPSGLTTLTVQNRAGLAQTSILVDAVPLAALPTGHITTVAGGSTYAGDGSLATVATLISASSVALDSKGNLYIADTGSHRVRKVSSTTGLITTVAGTGQSGFSGDNGPATAARLSYPWSLAVDSSGNLFIADNQNHRIRKVSATTGTITTVAGTGEPRFSGDGGPATAADLSSPFGVALDAAGNLFIADTGNYRIRKVDAATGTISTFAGTGRNGFSGDNGPAISASFAFPFAISLDAAGTLFIVDTLNQRIRKIAPNTGIVTTIAGSGQEDFSGDGGPATAAALADPMGVAVDAAGNVFIADYNNHRIRKVAEDNGLISTVAGTGNEDFGGDGGPAIVAQLSFPNGIVVDGAGNLLIGDTGNHRVRKMAAASQIITTIVGSGAKINIGDNGPATAAELGFLSAMVMTPAGDLLIADTANHRVRKVDAKSGIIVSIAGTGRSRFSGDGGPAISAALSFPEGVAVDAARNVFIADTGNHRIRKIDAQSGIMTTVAGNGEQGFSGDNGPATAASLASPKGIAMDAAGNLFIADFENHRIRRVDAATGIIGTVAGNGRQGFSGDNGPAMEASLAYPIALAIDRSGNLFIADNVNSRVRKVDAGTRIITTIAGNGRFEFSGDGGPAAAAGLDQPYGIAFDSEGNLFIADEFNRRIRRVDARSGIITTASGNGQPGFTGDDGPAAGAALSEPRAVALDSMGDLFIADAPNSRIRAVRGPIR